MIEFGKLYTRISLSDFSYGVASQVNSHVWNKVMDEVLEPVENIFDDLLYEIEGEIYVSPYYDDYPKLFIRCPDILPRIALNIFRG